MPSQRRYRHDMNPRTLSTPTRYPPIHWFSFAVCLLQLLLIVAEVDAQSKPTPIRTAYSALSAGIGTLWLTHEDGYFRKHGLDSNLIYIRGGSTAVQAILAGEIHFGHLSPAPMAALRFAASVCLRTFSS